MVATGAGNGHLRIGQVFVQALVELVLVLTANLHAHDGGVAVLTNLGLVITAACENVLELLLSTRNIRGRECVEETETSMEPSRPREVATFMLFISIYVKKHGQPQ